MKFILLITLSIIIITFSSGQTVSHYNCEFSNGGEILENAFAGGLNSPQFNSIDINMDGLKDLVVFDRVGNKLNVFLRTTEGKLLFAPEFNDIFPEISGWMLLTDYNNDGFEDLFTSKNGGFEVWKCIKNGSNLKFEKVLNPNNDDDILTYKTAGGHIQLQCDNTDIPSVVDLDFDGDVDILSFAGTNSVYHYKNLTSENNISQDSFKFVLTETCWGKFIEHPLNEKVLLSNDRDRCAEWSFAEPRHIGSTILTFNPDGDEDYDVLLGDVGANTVSFIENGGDKYNAWGTYLEEDFPQYDTPLDLDAFIGIFHLDADNDGKKDLIFTPNATNNEPYPQTANNIHFYKNTSTAGNSKYKFVESDFLSKTMIDLGGRVYPVFTDIDSDSLIDLIVGTGPVVDKDTILPSRIVFFKNSGSKNVPEFVLADDDFLNFSMISKINELNYFTPAFGDMDNDGDMDLLTGNQEGSLIYRENISSSDSGIKFGEPTFNYFDINIFSFSAPLIIDINNDGINDILVGCGQDYHSPLIYYGSVVYFQNQGNNSDPVFDSDPFSFPNTPEFGNLRLSYPSLNKSNAYLSLYKDADDEYLFAGHYYGGINIYSDISESIYSTLNPLYKDYGNINVGSNSAPAVADIDGDGYLEMLVGTPRGGFEFWNTDIKVTEGVKVDEFSEEINIYPNPCHDHVFFNFDNISETGIKATIFDLMGRKISEHNISPGNNKINIEKLTIGTYLLKIQLNEKTLNHKLIKSTY